MDLEYIEKMSAKGVLENLGEIVSGIDEVFGAGYAKQHPELVGQLLNAASIDYSGTVIHYDLEDLIKVVSSLKTEE